MAQSVNNTSSSRNSTGVTSTFTCGDGLTAQDYDFVKYWLYSRDASNTSWYLETTYTVYPTGTDTTVIHTFTLLDNRKDYLVDLTVQNIYSGTPESVYGNIVFKASPGLPTSISDSPSQTSATIYFTKGALGHYTNFSWTSGGSIFALTSGTSYNITGLSAGTTYEVFLQSERASGDGGYLSDSWQSYQFTTTSPPTLGQPSSSNSVGTNSISYTLNSVTNATWYNVSLYLNGNLVTYNEYSYATSGSFTGLIHNTQYTMVITVSANGYNSNSNTYYPTTNTLSAPGIPSNVSVTQPSQTLSVDVYYSWGSNATGMDIRWSTDASNWSNYTNQSNNNYPSPNYNFGVGSAGNKYFQVCSRRSDGTNIVYSSWVDASPYPINISDRPENFAWSFIISSGGNIYSRSGNTLYLMPYTDWNSFTSKINAFRTYLGYSAATFTQVSTDTPVTKELFNEARNALSALSGYFTGGKTIPAARVTGDNILVASYYTDMRDAMNSIS